MLLLKAVVFGCEFLLVVDEDLNLIFQCRVRNCQNSDFFFEFLFLGECVDMIVHGNIA